MGPTMLSILMIGTSSLVVFGMFVSVRSFGILARRIENSNALTRQSCEASAQRVIRTERRIADDEMATIEVVREMMKSNIERSA